MAKISADDYVLCVGLSTCWSTAENKHKANHPKIHPRNKSQKPEVYRIRSPHRLINNKLNTITKSMVHPHSLTYLADSLTEVMLVKAINASKFCRAVLSGWSSLRSGRTTSNTLCPGNATSGLMDIESFARAWEARCLPIAEFSKASGISTYNNH